MGALVRLITAGAAGWHRFWFLPQDPLPLCWMRLLVGAMLLYTHLIWTIDLLGFFGASGWNNAGILATLQHDTLAWSLWWWVPAGSEFQFHAVCLAVLLLFCLGVATRVTSVLAWVITVSYAHRSMLASFGLDQINAMLAFYLMLSPCGARLSVDSWWRKRRNRPAPQPSAAASLVIRLIQVHVCVIYFWAGLSKLQGASWWTGDAIWQVIANYEYQSLDLTWLAGYPFVLQLATHAVVLFEITFPFVVWQRRLRPVALLIGLMVHLGIGVCFGMWTFGLIMICAYLAFFDSETITAATRAIMRTMRVGSGEVASQVAVPKQNVGTLEVEPRGAAGVASNGEPVGNGVASQGVAPAPSAAGVMKMEEVDAVRAAAKTQTEPSSMPHDSGTGGGMGSGSTANDDQSASSGRRRRYVADQLFYVGRSKPQRANVRAYFHRHKIPCYVLRGAAELIEKTINLRRATIVLRAKDFSSAELQFWCDELVESNPDGQFRVFILPDANRQHSAADLQVSDRIGLFRLSATTTLRRIRKLYLNQQAEAAEAIDPDIPLPLPKSPPETHAFRAARLIGLLLMVTLGMGCGANKNDPKVQLERARMMLDRGQLHDAAQAFSTALEKRPGNADDYYDRGVTYERLKQLDQALSDYTEALRLDPSHAQAMNNRAVVLAQLGRVEEALGDLAQAIEIDPNDALAWGNRALAHHELGNYSAAIDDYSQALQLQAEPRLHFQRGNVYMDDGQSKLAIKDFTAAVGMDAGFVRAYLNRANALVQIGELNKAVEDLQIAGEMDRELSMQGSIQQLQRQIRSQRWQDTAIAGMQAWLRTQGYEIRNATDQTMSRFTLHSITAPDDSVNGATDAGEGLPCIMALTGPRGAPVLDAALTQDLMQYEGDVGLLVIDKQRLVEAAEQAASDRPGWLRDWRFAWRPLASDFLPSQVEVQLGPPAG